MTDSNAPAVRLEELCSALLAGEWQTDSTRRAALVDGLTTLIAADADWMPQAVDRALPALQALMANFPRYAREMRVVGGMFGATVDPGAEASAEATDPEESDLIDLHWRGFPHRTDNKVKVLAIRLHAFRDLGRGAPLDRAHACSWLEVSSWYVAEGDRFYRAEVSLDWFIRPLLFDQQAADSTNADDKAMRADALQRYFALCRCIARLREQGHAIDDSVLRERAPEDSDAPQR